MTSERERREKTRETSRETRGAGGVASEDENTEHLDAFLRGDAEEVRTTFNGHMYSNIHQVISNSLTRSQCKQLRIYSITNTSQTQVQRALEKYEKENANDVDEDVHLTGKGLFDWASQDFSAGGVKDTLESQYVVVFISHSHSVHFTLTHT